MVCALPVSSEAADLSWVPAAEASHVAVPQVPSRPARVPDNQAGKRTKVSKCALCITSLNLVLEAFASQNQRNMPHWTARARPWTRGRAGSGATEMGSGLSHSFVSQVSLCAWGHCRLLDKPLSVFPSGTTGQRTVAISNLSHASRPCERLRGGPAATDWLISSLFPCPLSTVPCPCVHGSRC